MPKIAVIGDDEVYESTKKRKRDSEFSNSKHGNYAGGFLGTTPASSISIPSTLFDNLAAYWKLDTSDGTFTRDVNGLNPLAKVNDITVNTGKINNGHKFQSLSELSENVLNSAFNFPSEFSLSFWFRINIAGVEAQVYRMAHKTEFTNEGFEILTNDTRNVAAVTYGPSGGFGMNPSGTMTVGVWYFFVLRFKASNSTGSFFWYNESALISQTDVIGEYVPSSTSKLRIGNFIGGEVTLNFTIDEFGLWSRALTNTEVISLWNNGAGRTYPFS